MAYKLLEQEKNDLMYRFCSVADTDLKIAGPLRRTIDYAATLTGGRLTSTA